MNNKQTYRVGDRLMSGNVRTKAEHLWDVDHEENCKQARFARDMLSKQEATWDMNTRMEDIKIMSKLESALSKAMFPIVACLPDRYTKNILNEVLCELEFNKVFYFDYLDDLMADIENNERRLVITSNDYRFGHLCGRDIAGTVEDANIVSHYTTHHCMIDGYNEVQRRNLSKSGYDVFKLLIGNAERNEIYNGLRSLILGYYVLYLIEAIFGKEELSRIRNKEIKLGISLSELEGLINRKNFKVLSVGDHSHNKNVMDLCNKMCIPCVHYVGKAKDAIEVLLNDSTFDVILSDYRLSDKPANKLFDNMLKLTKGNEFSPEFLITSGYSKSEVFHLKRYGVRIFDEINPENIEIFLKGCYVNKIRKFLAKKL